MLQDIRTKIFYLFIFLFSIFASSGKAQTFEEITDSLVQLLPQTHNNFKRIDLLNEISYAFRRISTKKVLEYGRIAYTEAMKVEYIQGAAIAKKNIGIGYYKEGAHSDTIINSYKESIELAKMVDDYYTQAACKNNIAIIYSLKKKINTSIHYYLEGIEILDQYEEGDIRLKALMLANIARSYILLDDFQKALEYQNRAAQIAKEKGYDSIISMYSSNHGKILLNLGEIKEAREVLTEGLQYCRKIEDKMSRVWVLKEIAALEFDQKNYMKAKMTAELARELAVRLNYGIGISDVDVLLMKIEFKTKRFSDVIKIARSIIDNEYKTDYLGYKQEARLYLAMVYESTGDFQQAWEYGKKYHFVNDSIRITEKELFAEELEAKYQNNKKTREIATLSKEKIVLDDYVGLLTKLSMTLGVSAVFILFLLYRWRRNLQTIKEKNNELEKYIEYSLQLENFAYIASHDLRTPLRTIISFSQLLRRSVREKLKEHEIDYLDFIIRGGKEMSILINDLLMFSTIQNQVIAQEHIDVKEMLKNIIELNQTYIEEKNALVNIECESIMVLGDRVKLTQLFQNLILNAVKFSRSGVIPRVDIIAYAKGENLRIKVKDNGIGIEEAYFDKVFLIFKRLNNKEDFEGSGMGLAVCKKIVEIHKGKIWLQSEYGKGSTFNVLLPNLSPQNTTKYKEKNELVGA